MHGDRDVFLPFWDYVRVVVASVEYVAFSAWQYFAFAPTSVTEIVTEEREKGIACFRGLKLGDASHLYAGNEPVSVAARFCEVYSDMNSRH